MTEPVSTWLVILEGDTMAEDASGRPFSCDCGLCRLKKRAEAEWGSTPVQHFPAAIGQQCPKGEDNHGPEASENAPASSLGDRRREPPSPGLPFLQRLLRIVASAAQGTQRRSSLDRMAQSRAGIREHSAVAGASEGAPRHAAVEGQKQSGPGIKEHSAVAGASEGACEDAADEGQKTKEKHSGPGIKEQREAEERRAVAGAAGGAPGRGGREKEEHTRTGVKSVGWGEQPTQGVGEKEQPDQSVAEGEQPKQGVGVGGACPTVTFLLSHLLDFLAHPLAAHVAGCVLESAATSRHILLVCSGAPSTAWASLWCILIGL